MTPKEMAMDIFSDILKMIPINEKISDTPQDEQSLLIAKRYSSKKISIYAVNKIIAKHYDDWDEHSKYWNEVYDELQKIKI